MPLGLRVYIDNWQLFHTAYRIKTETAVGCTSTPSKKKHMKKTITYFIGTLLLSGLVLAKDACPEGTIAFVCTNPEGKVKLSRCATGNTCYDKQADKENLRCCPVKETTGVAKKALLNVIQNGSDESLNQFKQTCNYSSPIDFLEDAEIHDAVKAAVANASLQLVRALIYADSNCVDVASGEQAQRWLGNEILLQKPVRLIHAMSYEEAESKKYKMSNMEKDEWAGTECQDQVCANERKEYFTKKRVALEGAKGKVPESMESIRTGLLRSLHKDH